MSASLERYILGVAAGNPDCHCEVLTKYDKTQAALSVIDDLVSRGLIEPVVVYVTTPAGDAALGASVKSEDK